MARADWTDEQNDAIVADYFAMLRDEDAGDRYSKAAHNRMLQARTGRSRGAIEKKHQNISAILKAIGETWIDGYKPLFNYQTSLEEAVARWLTARPDWFQRVVAGTREPGLQEQPILYLGPPPTLSNAPPPKEAAKAMDTARRFNVAERDERNRMLGRAGEERVIVHEQALLRGAGRDDLAKEVRWVSEEEGDGFGYDIASFEPDGRDRLIEVKTTNGWERTPFHITRNELSVADANRETWCLFRLYNFAREPRAFELRPPLESHVSLTPTSFLASIR